jgi:flagellar hook assembly protein FlgD
LLRVGSNTVFWDGRDELGNIVSDVETINYLVSGFIPGCEPCEAEDQTSFHGLKSNYVLVEGTTPGMPLVSIKSDPYVVYLSYSQVSALEYSLEEDAVVTVTIADPSGAVVRMLLSAVSQTAGAHEVVWDGSDDGGSPVAPEGNYTFTVAATNAASGSSTSRKGNIIVRN